MGYFRCSLFLSTRLSQATDNPMENKISQNEFHSSTQKEMCAFHMRCAVCGVRQRRLPCCFVCVYTISFSIGSIKLRSLNEQPHGKKKVYFLSRRLGSSFSGCETSTFFKSIEIAADVIRNHANDCPFILSLCATAPHTHTQSR